MRPSVIFMFSGQGSHYYHMGQEPHIYIDLGPSGTLASFVKYNLPDQSDSQIFFLTPFWTGLQKPEKLKDIKGF